MDPGSLLLSVCATVLCLRGTAADRPSCLCSDIPQVPLTNPPPESCNSTFRYTCMDGYKRRVGTSNLIKCNKDDDGVIRWSKPKLTCIRDPLRPTTPQPSSPPTSRPPSSPPPESTASQTTTVISSSQQTTSSGGSLMSEAPEISSAAPTLPTEQSHTSQETEAKSRTTSSSSTADPFSRTTVDPHRSSQTEQNVGKSTTAALVVATAVVIGCAIIGIWYYMRRRSSRNSPLGRAEEMAAIKDAP